MTSTTTTTTTMPAAELEEAIDPTNLTREQLVAQFGYNLVDHLEQIPFGAADGVVTADRYIHTNEMPVVLPGGKRYTLRHTRSVNRAEYEAVEYLDQFADLAWRDDVYGFSC